MIPVPLLIVDLDSTVRYGKDELGRFVNGPDDVVIFPEVPGLLIRWVNRHPGGRVLAVSNQGGVGLGIADRDQVAAAMQRTVEEVERLATDGGYCQRVLERDGSLRPPLIEQVQWCLHAPDAHCWCRKPQTGMVLDGVRYLEVAHPDERYPRDLALFVGDRNEDALCAKALDVRFMWAPDWRAS